MQIVVIDPAALSRVQITRETSTNIPTGSPGSMLLTGIDSNLRQCIRIYEICSKCDIFEEYK